jgi:hypothetical protein
MKINSEINVEKNFVLFSLAMPLVCERVEVSYKEIERDEESISFEVGNIPFSLGWEEKRKYSWKEGIGEVKKRINYQLSVWHTSMGSRVHPPEAVDTLIFEGESIWCVMKKAIKFMFDNRVTNAIESVGSSIVAEQVEEM